MKYAQAGTMQAFNIQACFAIDYDFATHRCYFFGVNVLQAFTADNAMPVPNVAPVPFYLHCIIDSAASQPSSQGLRPSPTVVHITLCESNYVLIRA